MSIANGMSLFQYALRLYSNAKKGLVDCNKYIIDINLMKFIVPYVNPRQNINSGAITSDLLNHMGDSTL